MGKQKFLKCYVFKVLGKKQGKYAISVLSYLEIYS